MDSQPKPTFHIMTDLATDYGGENMEVRTAFPSRNHLIEALPTAQSKYPVFNTLGEAIGNAAHVLREEPSVIAVAIQKVEGKDDDEDDHDYFKLHLKGHHKFEHFKLAYRRIDEGKKHNNSVTLLRKVHSTTKSREEMFDVVSNTVGTMLNGYISVSLVLGILWGGSIIFGAGVLGLYHTYVKPLVIKSYPQVVRKIKHQAKHYGIGQKSGDDNLQSRTVSPRFYGDPF